ncbi:MAG: septation regulator SpoVG [Lachnospiraceae bacterium]|nr:septation regulator SpoVG [Lachnospiraceae bacterium]HCJ09313.1 septation protein SpoVG [Lachnospiraceae bacterium]
MEITDIRLKKVTKEGKMKAIVSITLDNEFAVHDIKVIEGEKGLFIAMPSRKAADGDYRDIAHPINQTTRERIQSMILAEYDKALLEDEEEA